MVAMTFTCPNPKCGLKLGLDIPVDISVPVRCRVCKFEFTTRADSRRIDDDILPPNHLICPISMRPLLDPVTTPCGHNFERDALEGYRRSLPKGSVATCPLCRSKLPNESTMFFGLNTNVAMRDILTILHKSCSDKPQV